MPTSRAQVVPVTPARASARRKPAAAELQPNDLADEMDRVLKISQPKVAPRVRTATSSTKPTVKAEKEGVARVKPTSTATRAPGARVAVETKSGSMDTKAGQVEKVRKVVSTNAEAGPSRVPIKSTKSTMDKPLTVDVPKRVAAITRTRLARDDSPTPAPARSRPVMLTKSKDKDDSAATRTKSTATSLKSAHPNSSSTRQPDTRLPDWAAPDSGLSSAARAAAVKEAVTTSLTTLYATVQAGYTINKPTRDWSHEAVRKVSTTATLAVRVLRELIDDRKVKATAESGMIKASVTLACRLVQQELYDDALAEIMIVRPRLARLCPTPTTLGSDILSSFLPFDAYRGAEGETRSLVVFMTCTAWTSCLLKGGQKACRQIPLAQSTQMFKLALTVPPTATHNSFVLLYRALRDTPTAGAWSHVTIATFTSVLVVVDKGGGGDVNDAVTTPARAWESVHKMLASAVKSEKAPLEEIHKVTKTLVDWAKTVVAMRRVEKERWFDGQEWATLMEFWIKLGKQLGDQSIVEKALGYMAPISTPSASKPKAQDSLAEVLRLSGELGSLHILIKKHRSNRSDMTGLAVESGLKTFDMAALSERLTGLTGTEKGKEAVSDALRNMEQVNRDCICLVEEGDGAGVPALTLRAYMTSTVDVTEDLLQNTNMASQVDLSIATYGTLRSLLALAKSMNLSKEGLSTALSLIQRGVQIETLAPEPALNVSQRIAILRSLAMFASSQAQALWKDTRPADAVEWAYLAANLPTVAIERYSGRQSQQDLDETSTRYIGDMRTYVSNRWALVVACFDKTGGDARSIEARVKCLSMRYVAFDKLLPQVATSTLADLLAADELLLNHTAVVRQSITSSQCDIEPILQAEIEPKYAPCFGVMLEHMGDQVGMKAQNQASDMTMARGFFRRAAELYEGFPVLKCRVLMRSLQSILDTGAGWDELDAGFIAVERAIDRLPGIAREEAASCAYMMRAVQAYHTEQDSKAVVSDMAGKAIIALRNVLIPRSNTTARTPPRPTARVNAKTKNAFVTPVRGRSVSEKGAAARSKPRQVSDSAVARENAVGGLKWTNVDALSEWLSNTVGLLGMLGLTMQRIEMIKVARSALREETSVQETWIGLSASLGVEYASLGKWTRAKTVLEHAARLVEGPNVSEGVRHVVLLKWCRFLAMTGRVEEAKKIFANVATTAAAFDEGRYTQYTDKVRGRCLYAETVALARMALASIAQAEGDFATAIKHVQIAHRVYSKRASLMSRLAPVIKKDVGPLFLQGAKLVAEDDPFSTSARSKLSRPTSMTNHESGPGSTEEEAASRQNQIIASAEPILAFWTGKLLGEELFFAGHDLLESLFEIATHLALRGTAGMTEIILSQAILLGELLRSTVYVGRALARRAALHVRMRRLEQSEEGLQQASDNFGETDGPDVVESRVALGDLLYRREAADEALQAFVQSGVEIEGMDDGFIQAEGVLPTPQKAVLSSKKEPLLPAILAHVLRQRVWLSVASGQGAKEVETLLVQLRALGVANNFKAGEMMLQGRLGMAEVTKAFKMDLFTSSLADSTIAMPISYKSRTRLPIHNLLDGAEAAYTSALSLCRESGTVEDVRQAAVALAMLYAYRSSLGQGSVETTRAAADLLVSTSSVTLHHELLEMIDNKYVDGPLDEQVWPTMGEVSDDDDPCRQIWNSMRSNPIYPPAPIDISSLHPEWAVVSLGVSDDLATLLITRHQKDVSPIVLCLPFDRQGKREIDDDGFPFKMARDEMVAIVDQSDESARGAKHVTTNEGRIEWWDTRHELDKRLGELLEGIETNWFGAFKSVLASQRGVESKVEILQTKLERVFTAALIGAGTDKRVSVQLDDALLRCFATLPSTTSEDEIEDLVYFILDVYGFHGVPVAIAELDIDQLVVDVKTVISELNSSTPKNGAAAIAASQGQDEHLFLILDKHTQIFPWESLNCMRGRSISRVPSLPFLLDQMRLAKTMSCRATPAPPTLSLASPLKSAPETPAPRSRTKTLRKGKMLKAVYQEQAPLVSALAASREDARIGMNARRVYYILNPSGDLHATQQHFEPWLAGMRQAAGWKGVQGRKVTELEMTAAMKECDLVLYFGHGGAEQYLRNHKLKAMPRCASTMLWGCSSGMLKDQGDLDRSGTAWSYMMAGCPNLVANLWDVTDRDIDRLSEHVLKNLNLDAAHLGGGRGGGGGGSSGQGQPGMLPLGNMSIPLAVAAARDECKMKYLTGAAPVVYGLPVWLY